MAKNQKQNAVPKKTETVAGSVPGGRRLIIILAATAALVYLNTLRNGFVLDDFIAIRNNTIVTQGITAIPQLLSTPYHWGNFAVSNDLYRPLSMVMFAIEYQLFDGSPAPGHFINVVLFTGCVILLFLFFDDLFEKKRTKLAFIAVLLFALHPIHTEVVANIKSRDELLCFFFAFLALNRFLKYVHTQKMSMLLSGSMCFFLSLISKESSIAFIAIIPLVFFGYRNEHRKQSIHITTATIAVAAAFLAIRFAVLTAHQASDISAVTFLDNSLVGASSFATRLATAIYILGYYIRLLLLPYPLLSDYSYNSIPLTSFSNIWVLASLLSYLGLAITGIYLLIKKHRSATAFGILFFLITIFLFSNIPFLVGATLAERFLFFASAGFCLLAAQAIEAVAIRIGNNSDLFRNKAAIGIIITIGIIYAGLTISRNSDWQDNYTLFSADSRNAPNNSRLYYNLGTNQLIAASEEMNPIEQTRLQQEGINNLRNCIAIYPAYALAVSQISNEYFKTKQFDSAELYSKKAIALDPQDTIAANNLAAIYFYANDYAKALVACKKIISTNPGYMRAWINTGSCYLHLNQFDSAIYYFHRAASVNPGSSSPYTRLGKLYRQMGIADSAIKYEAIAQQKNLLK